MSLMLKSIVSVALLLHASAAAPTSARSDKKCRVCGVSSAEIVLTGSTLPTPSFAPTFIGLGVGTQNYTCESTGTYTNVGALAELFDASCLYGTSSFTDLSSLAFRAWNASATSDVFESEAIISAARVITSPSESTLGQHYFVTNPVTGTGLSPKWDFTSNAFAGNPAAFVVGSKIDDVTAPSDTASNIDWLYLTNLTGALANEIYRIDTQGGQPPASCIPGSAEIFVKYTAMYWLTGGSF
ncbi:hypothetical protein BT96DRAFT_881869 [Gymnopus androsaceus JB14]|uniref:Malate dehydrogenase n=1 Tax=Gymnopus androsaceus JB14 TaxID=1447944 RepID=A0A6A4HS17_9AGAR|nr:hypothetical protein BT96DRAFT_881869 [Gymnopus androsaceus JB14]